MNIQEYTADIADDDLERICRHRNELIEVFNSVRRAGNCDKGDIAHAQELALEAFDELYHSEWRRLKSISGSIAWGRYVGNAPKPFHPQSMPAHNPSTLIAMGWLEGNI